MTAEAALGRCRRWRVVVQGKHGKIGPARQLLDRFVGRNRCLPGFQYAPRCVAGRRIPAPAAAWARLRRGTRRRTSCRHPLPQADWPKRQQRGRCLQACGRNRHRASGPACRRRPASHRIQHRKNRAPCRNAGRQWYFRERAFRRRDARGHEDKATCDGSIRSEEKFCGQAQCLYYGQDLPLAPSDSHRVCCLQSRPGRPCCVQCGRRSAMCSPPFIVCHDFLEHVLNMKLLSSGRLLFPGQHANGLHFRPTPARQTPPGFRLWKCAALPGGRLANR